MQDCACDLAISVISDIASQMKYLTESVDSPQLNRNSKVLSWIESEDVLFEDTGTGTQGREECKEHHYFTLLVYQH